jgi:hypothetical protein
VIPVIEIFRISSNFFEGKKRELENSLFQLFQKHQRTDSFMKEPTNNSQLERQFFEFKKKFENQGSIPNPGF